MKAYKGFNKDLTCRGFQFEEGKTYEEKEAKLCEKGFHACENPLDCFRYYSPGKSVYHEVELEDVCDERHSDDSKVVAKKIRIGAELNVANIVKAHFEYVTSRCKKVEGSVAGDFESVAVSDRQACSAGRSGSASAGRSGSASAGRAGSASAGEYGSASAGEYGSASAGWSGSSSAGRSGSASAGEYGSASAGLSGSASAGLSGSASAGEYGSASAGEYGSASAGEYGSASAGRSGSASAGRYGSASAGGYGSASAGEYGSASAGRAGSASAGANGVAACRGGRVKGGIGCLLALCEIDEDGKNKSAAAVLVDGKDIKDDTWYRLVDGKFVEAKNE